MLVFPAEIKDPAFESALSAIKNLSKVTDELEKRTVSQRYS